MALAKEVVFDVARDQVKSEDQPAGSTGSVDQFPVILDTHAASPLSETETFKSDRFCSTKKQASTVNKETRFVLVPSQTEETESATLETSEPLHRSKSTTQLHQEDAARGRPHVSRIQTDLGAGLGGMLTGHRRAPSSYAHTPAGLIDSLSPETRRENDLLSPTYASEARRPVSAHPGTRRTDHDSSDSDHKTNSRRRQARSRSRTARQSFSRSDRSEPEKINRSRSTKRDEDSNEVFSTRAHRYRSPGPRSGGFSGYTYAGQDRITPPATPRPNSDAARSSAVDQTAIQDQSNNHHISKRLYADSPNTSSAEENHSHHPTELEDERCVRITGSRRNSRLRGETDEKPSLTRARSQRRDRPSKDESIREHHSSNERHRHGTKTPVSARTPLSMASLLENAFAGNQLKHSRNSDTHSRHVSPCASPARSPPTPRGDRSPEDYFGHGYHSSGLTQQRSRPPSVDETHSKDLKHAGSAFRGVATLGASLAAKANPVLSRSSTSQSLETPSTSSQSRPSSGQRSRRPSPLLEETQTVYQSLSRTNSIATHDENTATRTTTYKVHEDRAAPKPAPHASGLLEHPRTALRASSYSHSPEQVRPAAPFRTYSTSTTQAYQQPGHPPTQQSFPGNASNVEPGTVLNAPTRPNSLPPCPRYTPVAGLHDWYTIRDMSFLNFCPTCMSFLGTTRFRDYFIPSHGRDPRQQTVCAMTYPWLRIAWLQSIKQDRKDLSLVWQIARGPPSGTKPCSGAKSDRRKWYHLTDPRTKRAVDNFEICSACVRNIDLIFPKLQFCVFDRPQDKKEVEKICNLNTNSRHFTSILGELERLSDRSREAIRHRDFQDFVDFVRRIARHRQCVKDALLATQLWHFIPELPELTICEECYEEVVWPIRDRPIARDVSKTLRIVPTLRRSTQLPGISCQLYSERMQRAFREAVSRNDFEILKQAAQYRYHMEHRLQDMHKLYEQDQQAGIDRGAEIEKNISIWKSIE